MAPEDIAAALPVGGALVLLYPLEDSLACFVLCHRHDTEQPADSVVAVAVVRIEYAPKDDAPLHGKAALTALATPVEQAFAPTARGVPGAPALERTGVAEVKALLDLSGVEHLGLSDSTHADDSASSDASSGLVSALLYRGARSVQATLWSVRDDTAALVGAWTWERLLAGETNKARALRTAVQRLRRCSGREAAAELRRTLL